LDIKLIVWDLDGVLWESSVGETGSTGQVNHQVIDFIKHSEQSGIIHSVCSKNDLVKVKTILEELDIWDLFVFPAIDYTPKGPTVNKIIESCQLSQFNVLFVDDNDININEVKYFSPDINTENNVDFIKSFNMPTGKSRTDQYKILEIKAVDRDNITYLEDSDIKISITDDNNCFVFYDRIIELVNRSNRLNFSNTKFPPALNGELMPYVHIQNRHNYVVFAWDKYGYYGLIGYFSTDERHHNIEHFVFSCRVLDMGIENYCSDWIQQHLAHKLSIALPTRDTSYIEHVDFDIARELISTKQELTFSSKDPKVILYGGCLSLPVWVNCTTKDMIDPAGFAPRPQSDDIEKVPDLIIVSVMNELAYAVSDGGSEWRAWNFDIKEYKHECEQFVAKAKQLNKSVLLVFPERLGPYANDIEPEIYDFWRNIDVDQIDIPMVTGQQDHCHFSRHSLSELAKQIDNWITEKL